MIRVIGLIVGAVVLVTYLAVIRWWGAVISLAVLTWFCTHGVVLARRMAGSHQSRAHWFFGPSWGLCVCTTGLLVLWLVGGRGPWTLLLAPWPIWGLLLLPIERVGEGLSLPTFDRKDLLAILLLLLLVPAVVGLPYAHVAEPVDGGGKAYRAYFTADFVWAMSVVAEISKGDMPPQNPFLTDGRLRYYWLSHFLSGAEYRVLGKRGVPIEEVALSNSIGYGLVFVAFLYGFVRAFGAGAWSAAGACGMVFLTNSFEALDRIWAWWGRNQLWERLIDVNIDAGTRWFYQGMPVDGLQRMLLYQPHHLSGYALGLSALMIVARRRDVSRPVVALTAGTFLGLSLLFSSFIAIIIGVTVAVVYAVRLLTPPQWIAMPTCAILGALPVGAAVYASTAMGYVDPNAGALVQFGVNPVAVVHWPYMLLLSFGPLLLLGVAGLVAAVVARRWEIASIAVLVAVGLGFYFLTDVPNMQHVWVGWRAGHILFIAFTVLTGVLFTELAGLSRAVRIGAGVLTGVLALLAAPTVAIDVFDAQDINNRGSGPTFPWTLKLTPAEVEALDWLKSQTPADVIVQPDTNTRATATWAYIPAFGERRMAAGLPGAMIPFRLYEEATKTVSDQIFSGGDATERAAAARRLKIDYLYVGPVEQVAHPELVGLLDTRPDLFGVAFRNPEVVIYWVRPVGAG